MMTQIYLERFNDKNSGEEGDEEWGEPLVGLVVAEHDAEGQEKEDRDQDGQEAKGPANKNAKPKDEKIIIWNNVFSQWQDWKSFWTETILC